MDKLRYSSAVLILSFVLAILPSSQAYCWNNPEVCTSWGAHLNGGVLHGGGCKYQCRRFGYDTGSCVNKPLDYCPSTFPWHCVCRWLDTGTEKSS